VVEVVKKLNDAPGVVGVTIRNLLPDLDLIHGCFCVVLRALLHLQGNMSLPNAVRF
jgi:hypothetical protein